MIENEVCDLEHSKELKELGVKQESLFLWTQKEDFTDLSKIRENKIPIFKRELSDAGFNWYSAFTIGELGNILKPYLKKDIWLSNEIGKSMNNATYMEDEANSKADMVIYLIKNDILKVN